MHLYPSLKYKVLCRAWEQFGTRCIMGTVSHFGSYGGNFIFGKDLDKPMLHHSETKHVAFNMADFTECTGV